jgi:hypothetical protein
MTEIAERLDQKLHEWVPERSQEVEQMVSEIIELADDDTLDIGRSRRAEQEVLDILDED